jgi:hypothetical protein
MSVYVCVCVRERETAYKLRLLTSMTRFLKVEKESALQMCFTREQVRVKFNDSSRKTLRYRLSE